ncbi:uncharacterized protein LOC124818111 [Hydra vulgaris]|uniref:uncharacterized protein LOC124818111 n=1 Tax=Hydra vulgaris TaxID=6087 RepID=UPI0032E9C1A7
MPNIRRTYSNRGKEQAPKRRIDTNSPTIKRKLDYIESQLLKGHNEHEYRELLNEYYTLTGTEYPIRESVEHIENKISKQQEKPNDNTAGPSKMLRRESTIDDAGTELTKPDIDGFILDCEERQSVIQAEHENAIENKETTNKTSGTKIIEISLDEEWIEEEDIACYDNITRTDRCAKLKLDNSELLCFNKDIRRGFDIYRVIHTGKPTHSIWYNQKETRCDALDLCTKTHKICKYFDSKESEYSGTLHTHCILASYVLERAERSPEGEQL